MCETGYYYKDGTPILLGDKIKIKSDYDIDVFEELKLVNNGSYITILTSNLWNIEGFVVTNISKYSDKSNKLEKITLAISSDENQVNFNELYEFINGNGFKVNISNGNYFCYDSNKNEFGFRDYFSKCTKMYTSSEKFMKKINKIMKKNV
jgi:hypothetical protein